MLDQATKEQLKGVFAPLKNQYTLKASVPAGHVSGEELTALLDAVADCSPNITTQFSEGEAFGFSILKNGHDSRIMFKAVPNGHEFTTLLMALLNLDGIGKNLPDTAMAQRIAQIAGPVEVSSYISLTCTNCPDVVQALNIIAILNPGVQHHIIDGGIHKDDIEALGIQAVPSVYVNGQLLHVGRASLPELVEKLGQQVGFAPNTTEVVQKNYDVVVVGGGPAGVSSAIYSARKGLKVALVAEKIGGQLNETQAIENMISVPKTTGVELSVNLTSHLQDYPIDVLENRRVETIAEENGVYALATSLNEQLVTPAVIAATGASWRRLGVPGEADYIGSGVAFCTHCDGPFYKGKKVVVIGGGNSGLEAAIDLSSIATHVTVLEYMDELKGDKVLQDKLAQLPNVEVVTGAETMEVKGDGRKVVGLAYKLRATGEVHQVVTDGVFVQIGLKANSQVFAGLVATNRFGEIEIDAHCRTNKTGIYAAGDVSVVPYKQIVIAMGEGSKAALSAFEDKIKGALAAVDQAVLAV